MKPPGCLQSSRSGIDTKHFPISTTDLSGWYCRCQQWNAWTAGMQTGTMCCTSRLPVGQMSNVTTLYISTDIWSGMSLLFYLWLCLRFLFWWCRCHKDVKPYQVSMRQSSWWLVLWCGVCWCEVWGVSLLAGRVQLRGKTCGTKMSVYVTAWQHCDKLWKVSVVDMVGNSFLEVTIY